MYKSVPATLAAIIALAALLAISAILSDRGQQMVRNDEPAAGSSGMARPHPPLDLAPGEPLKAPL
jgi:hypothetical protein